MLSIRIAGGEELAVAGAVRVFKRTTSLGGVESLIKPRRSMEGPSSPVPGDLLRLSIGLEALEDGGRPRGRASHDEWGRHRTRVSSGARGHPNATHRVGLRGRGRRSGGA